MDEKFIIKKYFKYLANSKDSLRIRDDVASINVADEKYIEMIEISQNKWAKVFERPLEEVKALQNAIIDSTHLNHIDIDHLFQRNYTQHVRKEEYQA